MLGAYTIKTMSINFITMILGDSESRTPVAFPLCAKLNVCTDSISTFHPNPAGFLEQVFLHYRKPTIKNKTKNNNLHIIMESNICLSKTCV